MTLRQKQSKFAIMVAHLIQHAYINGYELTIGKAYTEQSDPYVHPRSLHKMRLAIDLNLFKDGKYLPDTQEHRFLGEFWESIGGTWGGYFGDGNHYSLEHNGMK